MKSRDKKTALGERVLKLSIVLNSEFRLTLNVMLEFEILLKQPRLDEPMELFREREFENLL